MINYLFLSLELYHNLIFQMDVRKGEAAFEERIQMNPLSVALTVGQSDFFPLS